MSDNIKIFSHRGFLENNSEIIEQNSVKSLENALKNSFEAIEFDIWFLNNKFILSHDEPQNIESLATIDDYFNYKNELNYWLDFKNLDQNNSKNAIKELKLKVSQYNISKNNLHFAPYNTNYKEAQLILNEIRNEFGIDANFLAICDDVAQKQDLIDFITKNNVKHLSINYKILLQDENFLTFLLKNNIEIFAWTVNDVKNYKLLLDKNIKNFASDINLTQI